MRFGNRYFIRIHNIVRRWILDCRFINIHLHDHSWRDFDSSCVDVCSRNITGKTASIFIHNKLAYVFCNDRRIPNCQLKLWLRPDVFDFRNNFVGFVPDELLHYD